MNKSKNKIFPKTYETSGGYSMIELIFYVALFALLTTAVINSIITMTKSFREANVHLEIIHSDAIIERIAREIRKANSITTISAGDLQLATTDSGGAAKTIEFHLSGTNAQLYENSVLTGNLNTPNISVTGLTFTQVTTSTGSAVRVQLTVKSLNDPQARTFDYYDTIVLRGSY